MTITYTIPGATPLNQLDPTALDGVPPNNDNDDCVPTSLAEGLHILTGQTFDGDELKDAAADYGPGYVGPMAASAFVATCAAHGVTLAPHNGSQADLIATIHSEVSAGHPVVLTMPSQWGTAPADPMNPGSSHVGCAVGVGDAEIRVMNPWGGFWQDQPDSWWQPRLCYGQVWIMQKASGGTMVPENWTDDGTTLTAPNGIPVTQGFREHVLNATGGWPQWNEPLEAASAATPLELSNPSLGGGTHQPFRATLLEWTQGGGVIEAWVGVEYLALTKALAQAQANLTAALGQRDALSSQLAAAQQQEAASVAEVTTLQQQLAAALAAQPQPVAPPPPSALEQAAVQLAPALKAFLAAANALA